MNRQWMGAVGVVVVLAVAGAGAQQAAAALKSEKEQRSYALGMDLGAQFKKMAVEIDPAVFAKGLGDALVGGKTQMTEDEAKAAIARLQAALKARQNDVARGTAPAGSTIK